MSQNNCSFADQVRYLSDSSSDDGADSVHDVNDNDSDGVLTQADRVQTGLRVPAVQPLKRRKLEVPVLVQREKKQKERERILREAFADLNKVNKSTKTKFVGGANGLQARRARAMASHLQLVTKNDRTFTVAADIAAESHGFARKWGGRQLRGWTRQWISDRELPKSIRGSHTKVRSLLDDPVIAAELRAYLRSNKWAMNPEKLTQFTENKLIPSAADEYLRHIVHNEMPKGLRKYMEIELFPRIHLKVGRGISLSTALCWMLKEGFWYISHKKGLYFDGHDRPDVVAYRQDHFLPTMQKHEAQLIRYAVGDVGTEVDIKPSNYVERHLVMVPQDEMTAQANDSQEKSWVLGEEHRLRKKGPGRGLHKSDVICSTVGYLEEASQTLEYRKNYDGY